MEDVNMSVGGSQKKSSFKNGRGYCGYHTTWDNKRVFCRSMLEKIQCLLLDKQHVYYLMEQHVYVIDNRTYKPDFFIYIDNTYTILNSIIEIKDSIKECTTYLSLYKKYFLELGINYNALTYNRAYYKQHKDFKSCLLEYIDRSDSYDMSGSNNPSYGIKFSEERLEAHTKLMLECQSRPEVRKKRSIAMQITHKTRPELRISISTAQIKHQEILRVQKYGVKKQNICIFCGDVVDTYDLLDKQYCKKASCKGSWCNYKAKLNGTSGHLHTEEDKKKIMYSLLIKHGLKLYALYGKLDETTIILYKEMHCRPNSRFSYKSIIKYYGSIELYIQKIEGLYNENN